MLEEEGHLTLTALSWQDPQNLNRMEKGELGGALSPPQLAGATASMPCPGPRLKGLLMTAQMRALSKLGTSEQT